MYTKSFNSSVNGNDYFHDINIDNNDNVYLVGTYSAANNLSSISTVKLNSSGSIQWQNTQTADSGTNEGMYVLIDNISNVYVGGNESNSSSSLPSIDRLSAITLTS